MILNRISDSEFISKLTQIVENNLANEDFCVNELADKFGISRSQIHRRLKSITNQSVSQFIREVKLIKSREMLSKKEGTVSEIAYRVGFGSPSYFNKCFHEYFGHSPGEFIKNSSEFPEKELLKINSEPEEIETVSKIKTTSSKKASFKKSLLGLGVVIIIALSVLIYLYAHKTETINDKSIAVLPLKSLSNDMQIKYIAQGLMEDIRNRLSRIEALEVKSQMSSERFIDANMTIPEIAKELGVSYIVEGSIIPDNGRIRINIQLISAQKDKHVWAENFDKNLAGIHDFISDVSKQITEQLETILTPHEIDLLSEQTIQFTEAHNFYLLGRYCLNLRGKVNHYKSKEFFNLALECDSNYSLAYAGLADSYARLAHNNDEPREEAFLKAKELALKALSIDENLAEAHATLGSIAACYDWDWELAEKEFQLALKLNPNNAIAHQWYSQYLDVVGRRDEARKHINIAIELNPYAENAHYLSMYYYYRDGNYNEFIKRYGAWARLKAYLFTGQYDKGIDHLCKYFGSFLTGNEDIKLRNVYEEAGIEEALRWYIGNEKERNPTNYRLIASMYAFIGEKEQAIDYLEKAYTARKNFLPLIKYEPEYEILRTEPRFIELLREMNLEGY